jgi:predicted RecB family endonuclease
MVAIPTLADLEQLATHVGIEVLAIIPDFYLTHHAGWVGKIKDWLEIISLDDSAWIEP